MPLANKTPGELLDLLESIDRQIFLFAQKEIVRRLKSGTPEQRVKFLNAMLAHRCHQMREAELNKKLNHIDQMISTIN